MSSTLLVILIVAIGFALAFALSEWVVRRMDRSESDDFPTG